ncbi:MAG TPA: phosphoadenylyl-sulfate reductase [Cytophagales bacterium]|nr:phosphoadenylyl-sulfate reductase [Cytophagales bacterium]
MEELLKYVQSHSIEESLWYLSSRFKDKIVFSTSFGYEDQVISHIIFENKIPIRVFTLDTGRMFPETYKVMNSTNNRYDTKVQVYYPKNDAVEKMVSTKGPMSFYDSVENRKECCFIRKVEPLNRALAGMDCWITGIRADQSGNRKEMLPVEWDESHKLFKYHPLFNWTLDDVKAYIEKYNIPYNVLHDRGFPSIGCQPCTRAVAPGEDVRAGRWWWESDSKKECGLHVH